MSCSRSVTSWSVVFVFQLLVVVVIDVRSPLYLYDLNWNLRVSIIAFCVVRCVVSIYISHQNWVCLLLIIFKYSSSSIFVIFAYRMIRLVQILTNNKRFIFEVSFTLIVVWCGGCPTNNVCVYVVSHNII